MISWTKNGKPTTRVAFHINAPRQVVYRALLDESAVGKWMVPQGMTSQVHLFEPHEGGAYHISLTYEDLSAIGKTSAHTDTFHGHFIKLVPNEQVVETAEFVTLDPALRGEMIIKYTLLDAEEGTDVLAVHEGLPPGLSAADNETGWRMSLAKLASFAEAEFDSEAHGF